MDEKDFREMSAYKQTLDDNGKQRPMTFYDKYIKKDKTKGEKKESKSAIWWMIMIFCLVYGFEILYNAMLNGPAAP